MRYVGGCVMVDVRKMYVKDYQPLQEPMVRTVEEKLRTEDVSSASPEGVATVRSL